MTTEPTLFEWAESRPCAKIIDAVPYLVERIRRARHEDQPPQPPVGAAKIISIPKRGAA